MKEIEQIFSQDVSHHAYCVVAPDTALTANFILEMLASSWQMSVRGNPDIWHLSTPKLSLEAGHYHQLQSWHNRRPVFERKVCLIETQKMSWEIQNSLLKTFEEANSGTYFFLLVPHLNGLLPTLISRLYVITSSEHQELDAVEKEVVAFLTNAPVKRFKLVESLIDEKDTERCFSFVSELERQLHRLYLKGVEGDLSLLPAIKKVTLIKQEFLARAPWIKGLMEQLVFLVPVVNDQGD